MNAANSQRLLQHIRRLAGDPPGAASDGELLQRYLVSREEAAFAALVRRHGAMVFSVCQSVLRQRQDAEDAFQAAFLILARKAGSIRRHEGLGGWLQRVAYRVALKARADNLRRRQCEAKTARSAVAEPSSDDLSWGEMRAILHAELATLPERFRAPLVLCYLEGLTQEEAARQLGWTAATVKGRLQRGRDKLRRRLERRGIALTAALGAAMTAQALAETAVRSGGLLTRTSATTAATALAREFLRPLLPLKLVMLSGLMLSMGVGIGGLALHSPPAEPRPSGRGGSDRSLTVAAPKEAVDAHGDPLPGGAVARLGTMHFNHGDRLNALLFSPDGKTIFSEGGGWLRTWDAATGKERDHFASAPRSSDGQLVLTADGKTMVSLRYEPTGLNDVVRVWDLAQKKEIRNLSLPVRRSESSVFRRNGLSPDGRLGAINLPVEMRIFDLATGRELYKLAKGGKDVRDVVFAGPDRLVTADTKQTIDVWEARTGKLLRRFLHDAPTGFLAASADGRWLAVLEHRPQEGIENWPDKDQVRIWDLTSGTKKHTLAARPKHWFRSAYFLGGGKRLLTSSLWQYGSELTVWDVQSGQRLREIRDVSGGVVAISEDGRRVAVGDVMGKFDLWDTETGHRLSSEEGRHAWAATVFFPPDDGRLCTIGYHSLSTWDARTGRRLESVEVPRSYNWNTPPRSFSPDGRYAVSFHGGGKEFQAILWDVGARRCLHTIPLPNDAEYVYLNDAFSPDSSLFATWHPSKEAVVRIWDVRTGKEIRSFKAGKTDWPGQLSFSVDGKTLFVAGKRIAGFDVSSGKELFSWHMKPLPDNSGAGIVVGGKALDPNDRCAWRGLAISPDGSLLACTLDGGFGGQRPPDRLALFDTRTGKLLRRWSDSDKPLSDAVISGYEVMVFSPDGQLLASSDGFAIHLWETATSKEIRTFLGHHGEINSLAFSSDGRRLASTSWDSTILIWDLTAPPTDATIEKCWADLATEDARPAHRAVWAMVRTPDKSIPLLMARLHPVQGVSRQQLDRLIQDLDSDRFAFREKATAELDKLGELAEPALRRALANKPSLELRRRIEPMLAKLDAAIPSGEALRSVRAARVLEHIGTAEARSLLRELAKGAEGATLTRAAQAALNRKK